MTLFYIYLLTLFSAILTGAVRFKSLTASFRVLLLLLIYTMVHELLTHTFAFDVRLNLVLIYFAYALISPLLYLFSFYLELRSRRTGKYVLMIIAAILLLDAVYIWNAGVIVGFPSKLIMFSTPFLLAGAMLVIWANLNTGFDLPLREKSSFIFAMAFIVYTAVSFTHLSLYEIVLETKAMKSWSQQIHTYTSMLYYATIGYSFWIDARQPGKSSI